MPGDGLLVWGTGITLCVLAILPFFLHQRAKERRTAEAEERARREGLNEPFSLHPVIDPERCIGTGSCLAACPEQDILGLRSGQGVTVSPAKCVGHGLCERACPVEAIQLVFGSERRGVDIPRIREDFQTNVPGLYVIGELGGMGLIRNAFEQGRQCVEGIARNGNRANGSPIPASGNGGDGRGNGTGANDGNGNGANGGGNGANGGGSDVLDLVIVGCGPAGLSAAFMARAQGMRIAVLERENIGGTVSHYPRKKLVMTEPLKIPGVGKVGAREILKEDLMAIWTDAIREAGLDVETGVTVTGLDPLAEGGFRVRSSKGEHRARKVILAIGRRGVPRKLDIPGEELSNVVYSLREPEAYAGDRILVVGGGDSAVEAALALAGQPGTEVRISYRRDRFSRIKAGNRERITRAEAEGAVSVLWSTEVVENRIGEVLLRRDAGASAGYGSGAQAGHGSGASAGHGSGEAAGHHSGGSAAHGPGEVFRLPNDHLFIFAGGALPTPFLERCGVQIDTKFGER